jgi:hypothetical protein
MLATMGKSGNNRQARKKSLVDKDEKIKFVVENYEKDHYKEFFEAMFPVVVVQKIKKENNLIFLPFFFVEFKQASDLGLSYVLVCCLIIIFL